MTFSEGENFIHFGVHFIGVLKGDKMRILTSQILFSHPTGAGAATSNMDGYTMLSDLFEGILQ